MRTKLMHAAALIALLALPAFAQDHGMPTRVLGTITSFDGQTLVVKSQDGHEVSISVPADLKIVANVKRTLSDVKPGDFAGAASVTGADGKLHADEVHVFPENLRGLGEGHRPLGPPAEHGAPGAAEAAGTHTMTNGTVVGVTGTPGAGVLKLKYKDGASDVEVATGVPVVAMIPGDMSLFKPGATVSILAQKKDGGLVATFCFAEKDGIKPML